MLKHKRKLLAQVCNRLQWEIEDTISMELLVSIINETGNGKRYIEAIKGPKSELQYKYISPLTQIAYWDLDAIHVCLGLTPGEFYFIFHHPCWYREDIIKRGRRILKNNGYGDYVQFFRSSARKAYQSILSLLRGA